MDQAIRLEISLRPQGPSESVTVQVRSWELGVAHGGLGGLVRSQVIEELPLNGRDVVQLAGLTAVVVPSRSRTRNINTGYGVPFSIAGARPTQNAIYLDGINIADHTGATPAGVTGILQGLDTLQEFSVLTTTRGPSLGRAAGGVINAVTRSGNNEFHGSGFYSLRDGRLDARNFFEAARDTDYSRHQTGARFGFPLRRDVLFGFLAVEWLNENDHTVAIDTTLSDKAREGDLLSGPVTIAPEIAAVLQAYPRPNGVVLGDTALFHFSNPQWTRQLSFSGRLDSQWIRGQQWSLRYSFDDAHRRDRSTFDLLARRNESRNQSLALNGLWELGPQFVHATRFGFSRSRAWDGRTDGTGAVINQPELAFLPGGHGPGIIDVPGLSTFPGVPGALDSDRAAYTSVQLYQDITWIRGRHSLALGGNLERTYFNFDSTSLPLGEFTFPSLKDFLSNRPSRFRAQLPGSDTVRGFRQWIVGMYAQDRWNLSPGLTLELGVRLERATVPTEVQGKLANLDELTDPETRVGRPLFEPPRGSHWYPHVGLAMALNDRRSTLLRAGYGMFPELILSNYLLLHGVRNPPFFNSAQLRNAAAGSFPSGAYLDLVAKGRPDQRVERIPRVFDQPYVQQWQLSLEHRFRRGRTVRFSYLGSHALHLSTLIEDANLRVPVRLPDGRWYFPPDAPRLNPHFGRIRDRIFDGHGFYYHGLEVEWQLAEPWHGWQGSIGYSFGKSLDDSSTTFAQTEAVNAVGVPVHDSRFNRGPSDYDIRHRWAGHLIGDLQVAGSGFFRRFLNGWRLAFLWEATSGLPFSATLAYDAAVSGTSRPDYRGGQRPDLRPGASNNPVLGTPERWIDLNVFQRPQPGFLGNLGRNTLRGPSYGNLDLSLARRLGAAFGKEGTSLELRAEVFNLLNHPNLALPDPRRTMVFTQDSVVEDFGRITEAYPGRRIQLGIRWAF